MCNKTKGIIALGLIIAFCIGGCKAWSAYSNRPTILYKRWIGGEVPADVSNLEGTYKFYLTESICALSFEAPPERIESIIMQKGMVEESLESPGFGLAGWSGTDNIPNDLQVYWVSHADDHDISKTGWVLYYSPRSQEAYWTNRSF